MAYQSEAELEMQFIEQLNIRLFQFQIMMRCWITLKFSLQNLIRIKSTSHFPLKSGNVYLT